MSNQNSVRQGGCQCGNIRYECIRQPQELYVCHCLECQKQSSSAFGISFIVPRENFHVIKGRPQCWQRKTESGKCLECVFCSVCGTRVWHQSTEPTNTISIKGGSLDEPVDISSAVHIWTARKLPGVIIPEEAVQFLKEPDSDKIS